MIELDIQEIVGNEITFKLLVEKPGVEGYLVAGIDEAGRGPVIGPMIMAGYQIRGMNLLELLSLDVRDSKELTVAERENVFGRLLAQSTKCVIAIVPPRVIDSWVSENKLNELEAYVTSRFIKDYLRNSRVIFVDAPSTGQSFMRYIRKYIVADKGPRIVAEPKADKLRPVVSAASIIAKVIRDKAVRLLARHIGTDLGSGYPSDPRTRRVLKMVMEKFPEAVRMSWGSVKKTSEASQ